MAKTQKAAKTAEHANPPAKSKSVTKAALPAAKRIKNAAPEEQRKYRTGTKQGILIGMLERSQGATVEEMAQAVGWQRHSVYGLLFGALKKKLGFAVTGSQEQRGHVYRIA